MDFNFSHLFKKSVGALFVQGLSMLLLFLLNWFLAKKLGAADYGTFTYAISWVYLFGVLSMLGLNMVIQRETIKYTPRKIRLLITYSRKVSFLVSIIVVLIFSAIVYLLLPNLENSHYGPLLLAIVALPAFSQLLLNKSICIGLKQVVASQLPDDIFRPALTLIGCLVLWQFVSPSVENGIVVLISSMFIAYLTSLLFAKRALPASSVEPAHGNNSEWMKLGFSFLILTAAVTINSRADILMLGFFGKTDQVGIYNIAVKLSALIGLALLLVNKVLTPYISKHINDDRENLVVIIKKFMRGIFIIGIIMLVLFYFYGHQVLGLFGVKFEQGYWPLIVLSVGQLLNVVVGPVGNLLTMSKFEKISVNIMIISTLINIILNSTLIPSFGMKGAAIATSISLFAWNIIHYFYVRKKLNINPAVI